MAKQAKKFPKKTINIDTENVNIKLPSGPPEYIASIYDFIKDSAEAANTAQMAFFIGAANKGKDLKTSIATAKSIHRSILGDNSIYTFLENINNFVNNFKEIKIVEKLKSIFNDSKIYDNNYWDQIANNLENILNLLNTPNNTNNNAIKVIISGINNKDIDALKELITNNKDLDTSSIENLKTLISTLNLLNTLNESSVEGAKNLNKMIVDIGKAILKLGFLNKLPTNMDKTKKLFEDLSNIFSNLKNANFIDEHVVQAIDDFDFIINHLITLTFKIRALTLISKINKKEQLTNVIDNIVSIFDHINSKKYLKQKEAQELQTSILWFNDQYKTIRQLFLNIRKLNIIGSKKSIKKLFDKINFLFSHINDINSIKVDDSENIVKVYTSLNNINLIIDILRQLNNDNIDIDKIQSNIIEYFNTIENIYIQLKDKLTKINDLGDLADQTKIANAKIKDVLTSTEDIAVGSSKKEKDIRRAQISMQGMGSFMITAAIVMSIGALIIEHGGGKFVKNALAFGVTLMLFETLVLAPALLYSKLGGQAIKGINDFNSFVILCATVMSIGALFVMLGNGKFIIGAFAFGIALMAFETLVIAPFVLFNTIGKNIFKGLTDFNSFLVVCVGIMMFGALFMALGGGKLVTKILAFGLLLGVFESLVVAPFILFGIIGTDVFRGLKDFSSLIVTCTIIMMIGALFMLLGGGKMVKYVLAFGLLLGMFEVLVIAPFLLFKLIGKEVMKSLKDFTTMLTVCTIILMVGALFMVINGGKLWKNALKFTLLLAAFEVGVIAPFLLFNIIKREVLTSLRDFTLFVAVTTICLLVGAVFMTIKNGMMGWYALEFTVILAAFITAMGAVGLAVSAMMKNQEVIKDIELFGLFILECSAALLPGAWFVSEYGWKPTAIYAGILFGFVLGMSSVANMVTTFMKDDRLLEMHLFGLYIIECSAAMISGAWFVSEYGAVPTALYAVILGLFVSSMGVIAKTLSKIIKPKTLISASMFGLFIIACSGAMILGAWFIAEYGSESVWKYGLLLLGFITLAGLIMFGLAAIMGPISIGISAGVALGIALLGLTGSLLLVNLLFKNDEGGNKLFKNIGLLLLAIGEIGLIFTALSVLSGFIIFTSIGVTAMAISLTALTGVFTLINAIFDNDKDAKLLKKNIKLIGGLLTGNDEIKEEDSLKEVFWSLGNPFFVLWCAMGLVSALSISISMLALGSSFAIINDMIGGHGKELKENIEYLNILLLELGGIYTLLGVLFVFILFGSLPAMAIGASMTIVGNSFAIINNMIGEHGKELKKNIEYLNILLLELGGIYTLLGVLFVFISYGSLAAIAIGVSISSLGKSLQTINDIVNEIKTGQNNIKNNIKYLIEIINGDDKNSIKGLFESISNLGARLILEATLKMYALSKFSNSLNETITNIYDSILKLNEVKNVDSGIESIINHINKYLNIPANIEIGKAKKHIDDIVDFVGPLGEVISQIAESIQHIASLEVANKWDEKGNPIGYRNLKSEDFKLASDNVGTILTTMSGAFVQCWENGLQQLYESNNSPVKKVVKFSYSVAEIIAGIGEGVQRMATLQIPIDWDDKGHPISFRTLKQKDFDMMGKGVSTILTSIISAIGQIYYNQPKEVNLPNGENWTSLFDSGFLGGKSPISKVLRASFKISELLGNIGEGIEKMATLQIPIDWDDNGKPISFKTLTTQDFNNMGKGVGKLLTSIFQEMGKIYKTATLSDGTPIKKLFDSSGIKGFFTDNSPIGKVLNASFRVSELLSNMGEGIKNIAGMQIPDNWDDNGKPISFKTLTPQDFDNAGQSVGKIITSTISALSENMPIFENNEQIEKILNSVMPVSELISGMADGIIKLASAQVPNRWDKNGKPTHFIDITPEKIKEAGKTVGIITKSIAEELCKLGTSKEYLTLVGEFEYNASTGKYVMKDTNHSKVKEVFDSVSGVSNIISSIADAVIKIGSGLVADDWDDNGRPKHYKAIDITTTINNLNNTIEKIVPATATAIISVYNNNAKMFSDDENSPFNQAVKGISGATKIVSDIADSVIKISQCMVPDPKGGFTEDGKPKKWKPLDINSVQSQIKQFFEGDGTNGLMVVLLKALQNISTNYFSQSNLADDIEVIKQTNNNICTIIKTSAETISNIASLKIPTGFNNKGDATGYHILNETDIETAKQNMQKIILSLYSVLDNEDIKKCIKNKATISSECNDISSITSEINTLLSAILKDFKNMMLYNKDINELFKTPANSKRTENNDIEIGFIRDIYTIIDNVCKVALIMTNTSTNNDNNISQLLKIDNLQNNLNNITENINIVLSAYEDILSSTTEFCISTKFAENNDILMFLKSGKRDPNTFLINELLGDILGIYDKFISQFNKTTLKDDSNKTFGGIIEKSMNIIDIINSNIEDMFISFNDLSKLSSSLININSINNQEENPLLKQLKTILGFYSAVIIEFDKIYKQLNGLYKDNSSGAMIKLTADLSLIAKSVTEIFNDMNQTYQIFYGSIDKFKDSINNIINQFSSADHSLDISVANLKTNIDNIAKIYNETKITRNIWSGSSIITDIANDINKFINVMNKYDKKVFKSAIMCSTSIKEIINTMNNQKISKTFKENTKNLDKYVKTINKLKLNNINALTELTYQLNKLQQHLGGVDGLTSAIADKLSVVLQHLVQRLEESKDAINKADEIQSKRHKLINESITKIQDMLNNPLSVKVEQETTEMNMNNNESTETNTTQNGASSSYVESQQNNDKTPKPKTTKTPNDSQYMGRKSKQNNKNQQGN